MMARTLGVLHLGNVSLDGTRIKANASKHKAMSWDYANKLEKQLREEVAALLARSEQADEVEPDAGLDIPEELKRRRDRLEAIAAAKEEIAQRAAERHRAEMAAYEEKMAARAAKEAASGRKPGGRPPQEPQPGPASEGPGELHRSGVADHAVIGRLRAGVQRPGVGRQWLPPDRGGPCNGCLQ